MKCPFVIKVCTKCKRILVANTINFARKKGGLYNLCSRCKVCDKKYREDNEERIKEYKKEYRINNPNYNKQYYEKHEKELKEWAKQYRENNKDENLIILDKKSLENENELNWQLFGLNIIDEKRKATFMKIINKYVYYKEVPMTEEMLIEHNWSFREIGEFLFTWSQISD